MRTGELGLLERRDTSSSETERREWGMGVDLGMF